MEQERKYDLDEKGKSFKVSHTKIVTYNLEDFKKVKENLENDLLQFEKSKKELEENIKALGKVPNKEKLNRHRLEHTLIEKLNKLIEITRAISESEIQIKNIKNDLAEIEPKIKKLEELNG